MAATSCASHLSNARFRSWLLSPDKVPGRVTFLSLRPRDGFKPKAALMAAGSTSSSSKALIYEPLFHYLSPVAEQEAEESEQEKRDPITDENLDEWIKDSVSEIVKNIGEAPFLVEIFSRGGRKEGFRLEREAATPESWRHIQKRWARKKSQPPPDGIILVSELREELEEESKEANRDGDRPLIGSDSGVGAESSKVWGLLVQGRGMEVVACYILNTCRVFSPAGSATHFYLARAQCFGDPLELQLRNAWLQ